jgi:hypothetical protein
MVRSRVGGRVSGNPGRSDARQKAAGRGIWTAPLADLRGEDEGARAAGDVPLGQRGKHTRNSGRRM